MLPSQYANAPRQRDRFLARYSFQAVDLVHECVGGCGYTYYLNKKTKKEQLDSRDVTTHTFYRWDRLPDWISNKSGKVVVSSALLTDFALAQCTLRCVVLVVCGTWCMHAMHAGLKTITEGKTYLMVRLVPPRHRIATPPEPIVLPGLYVRGIATNIGKLTGDTPCISPPPSACLITLSTPIILRTWFAAPLLLV